MNDHNCLNSHGCRHSGHRGSAPCPDNHLVMHCKWYACAHAPHTTGESSPGNFASGGHPSYAMRQIPHTSPASPAPQVHAPTPCHVLTRVDRVEDEDAFEDDARGGGDVDGAWVPPRGDDRVSTMRARGGGDEGGACAPRGDV